MHCVMLVIVFCLTLAGASTFFFFFFFNDTATTEIYTLSLHDALPICRRLYGGPRPRLPDGRPAHGGGVPRDRKSTRLNSSHVKISYAVFCLKKKKANKVEHYRDITANIHNHTV